MHKIGIFAGSFDPFTLGHFDIVNRASKFFEKIYIGVAQNTSLKKCILNLQQRMDIVKLSVKEIPNVEVLSFSGFLVDFSKQMNADTIVRGLRTSNDFEYEKAIGEVYRSQEKSIEIFYLISSHNYSHISSTIVKELAVMGADLTNFVQSNAVDLVKKMYSEGK